MSNVEMSKPAMNAIELGMWIWGVIVVCLSAGTLWFLICMPADDVEKKGTAFVALIAAIGVVWKVFFDAHQSNVRNQSLTNLQCTTMELLGHVKELKAKFNKQGTD